MKSELDATPSPAPILHPNLAELYRRQVENLHEALNASDSRTEAAEILRATLDVARPALGAEHRLSLALTQNLAAVQGRLKRRTGSDVATLPADEEEGAKR